MSASVEQGFFRSKVGVALAFLYCTAVLQSFAQIGFDSAALRRINVRI